jgi:hypothetical protein
MGHRWFDADLIRLLRLETCWLASKVEEDSCQAIQKEIRDEAAEQLRPIFDLDQVMTFGLV